MSGDPNLFYTAFGRSAGHRNTKLGAKFRSVNDARLTSTQEFIQLKRRDSIDKCAWFFALA